MVQMVAREKSLVRMQLRAQAAGHARTEISVRDVAFCIDEPVERGGSNLGPTPTEALGASLLGCTHVIAQRIAAKAGFVIHDLQTRLDASFDRRGVSLAEEVDVPFPAMQLHIRITTDASAEQLAQLRTDLRRFCPVSKLLQAAGTVIDDHWEAVAP